MRSDRWVFLFLLGAVFFSWPILSILRDGLIQYLFLVWLVFIALICITALSSEREEGGK